VGSTDYIYWVQTYLAYDLLQDVLIEDVSKSSMLIIKYVQRMESSEGAGNGFFFPVILIF